MFLDTLSKVKTTTTDEPEDKKQLMDARSHVESIREPITFIPMYVRVTELLPESNYQNL